MAFRPGSQADPWEAKKLVKSEKTEEGGREILKALRGHCLSRSFPDPLRPVYTSVPGPVNLPVISYNCPALTPHKLGYVYDSCSNKPETPEVLLLWEPRRIEAGTLQTRNFLDTRIKSWAQRKRQALVAEVWERIRGTLRGLREGTPTTSLSRREHQWAGEPRGQSGSG